MHRFSACQFNFGPDEQLQILVRTALVSHSALSRRGGALRISVNVVTFFSCPIQLIITKCMSPVVPHQRRLFRPSHYTDDHRGSQEPQFPRHLIDELRRTPIPCEHFIPPYGQYLRSDTENRSGTRCHLCTTTSSIIRTQYIRSRDSSRILDRPRA